MVWESSPVDSFTYSCPVFPTPFIEGGVFYHYIFFPLCHWLIDHISVSLFLGSLFCSIDLCVSFCVNILLFWLLSLCSIVWNQGVWYLQLCSFFKIALAMPVFFFFFLYCSMVALQCCVSLHCTTKWISHTHTDYACLLWFLGFLSWLKRFP